jgi:hypothetical protein
VFAGRWVNKTMSKDATVMGNATKAGRLLDWQPETTFEQIINEITLAELADWNVTDLEHHQFGARLERFGIERHTGG